MPDINKMSLTRLQTVELYTSIVAMTGENAYKAARDQVRNSLAKAWPEILDKDAVTPEGEARDVLFTSKQLRAMGEGFLSLNKDTKNNGNDFLLVARMAEYLKLTKWLNHFSGIDTIPDLDFPLDDEPDLVSDEGDEK